MALTMALATSTTWERKEKVFLESVNIDCHSILKNTEKSCCLLSTYLHKQAASHSSSPWIWVEQNFQTSACLKRISVTWEIFTHNTGLNPEAAFLLQHGLWQYVKSFVELQKPFKWSHWNNLIKNGMWPCDLTELSCVSLLLWSYLILV